jgi:hypothetical protein
VNFERVGKAEEKETPQAAAYRGVHRGCWCFRADPGRDNQGTDKKRRRQETTEEELQSRAGSNPRKSAETEGSKKRDPRQKMLSDVNAQPGSSGRWFFARLRFQARALQESQSV